MKLQQYIYIVLLQFAFLLGHAQPPKEVQEFKNDSTETFYYIVKGDTIPREFIDLDEVVLLKKLKFNSKEDRRRYLILRRKTRKVYPYAKLASERLTSMSERLKTIEKKSDRKKYTRRIQKYIEEEFSRTDIGEAHSSSNRQNRIQFGEGVANGVEGFLV